jgi:hypothetical protein
LNGRFGGTVAAPSAKLRAYETYGSASGTQFLTFEVLGPTLVGKVRPSASFSRHWTGGNEEDIAFTSQSNVYGIGAAFATALGEAKLIVRADAAYLQDTYHVKLPDEQPLDVSDDSWNILLGVDLQFAFFENVDALVGYRYLGRSVHRLEGETAGGIAFTLDGYGGEHCISAGISVLIGGV